MIHLKTFLQKFLVQTAEKKSNVTWDGVRIAKSTPVVKWIDPFGVHKIEVNRYVVRFYSQDRYAWEFLLSIWCYNRYVENSTIKPVFLKEIPVRIAFGANRDKPVNR